MAKYNTGNPVGSADPRDRNDNSIAFDEAVTSENPTFIDRRGRTRRTWQSVEDEANQQAADFTQAQGQRASEFSADQQSRETTFTNFLNSSGFEYLGLYAAGIEFTEYNQYVVSGGEAWFISQSTSLPYTTTGAGVPEAGALKSRGEALLRQELGSGIRRVDSLAGLQAISGRFSGDVAYMVGRTSAGDGGEGEFRWDASDLSAMLVAATVVSTSVDDVTNTITSAAHGLVDGDGVTVGVTINGLAANALYWIVGATTDTFQLSASYGGAAVDLTGTTNLSVLKLIDPAQGVYVCSDRTGAGGAWVRNLRLNETIFDVEVHADWFDGNLHAAFSYSSNVKCGNKIYYLQHPLVLTPQYTRLVGDGQNSRIYWGSVDVAPVMIDFPSRSVLEGLTLSGENLCGILVRAFSIYSAFQNLRLWKSTGFAFQLGLALGSESNANSLSCINILDCANGLSIIGSENTITNGVGFDSIAGTAVMLSNGSSNRLEVYIENCDVGIDVETSAVKTLISNCFIKRWNTYGIRVNASAYSTTIENNFFATDTGAADDTCIYAIEECIYGEGNTFGNAFPPVPLRRGTHVNFQRDAGAKVFLGRWLDNTIQKFRTVAATSGLGEQVIRAATIPAGAAGKRSIVHFKGKGRFFATTSSLKELRLSFGATKLTILSDSSATGSLWFDFEGSVSFIGSWTSQLITVVTTGPSGANCTSALASIDGTLSNDISILGEVTDASDRVDIYGFDTWWDVEI